MQAGQMRVNNASLLTTIPKHDMQKLTLNGSTTLW